MMKQIMTAIYSSGMETSANRLPLLSDLKRLTRTIGPLLVMAALTGCGHFQPKKTNIEAGRHENISAFILRKIDSKEQEPFDIQTALSQEISKICKDAEHKPPKNPVFPEILSASDLCARRADYEKRISEIENEKEGNQLLQEKAIQIYDGVIHILDAALLNRREVSKLGLRPWEKDISDAEKKLRAKIK